MTPGQQLRLVVWPSGPRQVLVVFCFLFFGALAEKADLAFALVGVNTCTAVLLPSRWRYKYPFVLLVFSWTGCCRADGVFFVFFWHGYGRCARVVDSVTTMTITTTIPYSSISVTHLQRGKRRRVGEELFFVSWIRHDFFL